MYALKYIIINVTFNSSFCYHERFHYHIHAFVKSRNRNILIKSLIKVLWTQK